MKYFITPEPQRMDPCEFWEYLQQFLPCEPTPTIQEPVPTPTEPITYEPPVLIQPTPIVGFEPVEQSIDKVYYYHSDHLGSSSYVTDSNGRPVAYYDYLPFGEVAVEHNQTTNFNNGYKFNAKELDQATGMSYYGARYYDSRLSVFVSVDPLAEETFEPYSYVGNNPIMFIDPKGMYREGVDGDFYDRNGNWIGTDGKDDGKRYVVIGKVEREIRKATKNNQHYSGEVKESENMLRIPTENVMDAVIASVDDSKKSQKEHGGHALINENTVYRWDEGSPPELDYDKNGNVKGARISTKSFIVNGKNIAPKDASKLEFWWHVHPDLYFKGFQFGDSTPSENDYFLQNTAKTKGFTGNTFVIGVRTEKVTFFNGKKSLLTMKLSNFIKIGNEKNNN